MSRMTRPNPSRLSLAPVRKTILRVGGRSPTLNCDEADVMHDGVEQGLVRMIPV